MTDLTEKWKKGELPSGWYYIKIADIVFIDFFEGKVWKNKKDKYIDEVITEVPSYEEWDKLNNACHELEKETACLTVDIVKLKELLKECKPYIGFDTYEFDEKVSKLLTKIDEALK